MNHAAAPTYIERRRHPGGSSAVKRGKHTIKVRATDLAGNVELGQATAQFKRIKKR